MSGLESMETLARPATLENLNSRRKADRRREGIWCMVQPQNSEITETGLWTAPRRPRNCTSDNACGCLPWEEAAGSARPRTVHL